MATVTHPRALGKPSNGRRRRAPQPRQLSSPLSRKPTVLRLYQQTLLMASQLVGFLGQLQRVQVHLLSVVECELPMAPHTQEIVHQTAETLHTLDVAVTTSRTQMMAALADLVAVLHEEAP